MRYVIVHLIRGRAKKYHENLTRLISKKCHVRDISKIIMPHLTFHSPIFSNNIIDVERVISEFIKELKPTKYELKGFGSFGEKVIFVNINPSKEMKLIPIEICKRLTKIKGIQSGQYDGENLHYHATLALPSGPHKFKSIMNILKNKSPIYTCTFDNIAIIKFIRGKWRIHKVFRIS